MVVKQVDTLKRKVGRTAIWLLYGWGVLLALVTSFRGPQYYANWGYEHCLFNYGSSLQYFLTGITAFLCFWVTRFHEKCSIRRVHNSWLWLIVTLAFAYAAVDEALGVHEALLSKLKGNLPWMKHLYIGNTGADSIFVLSCGICAVIFTLFIISELRKAPKAAVFYFIGLGLLLLSGAIDYFPKPMVQQKFPLGTEELGEYFAGASFCAAFLIYLLDRAGSALVSWLSAAEPETVPTTESRVTQTM